MKHHTVLIALMGLLATATLAHAQAVSAFQQMGPTGIKALIAGKRVFTVKSVDKGSPADGKIWPGDQVVGAGAMPFLKRVRFEFAAAIAQARTEKNKGKLVLMVRSKAGGRTMKRVTLQLPVVGPDTFNDTAPYNCPKTDALIAEVAEHIVRYKDGEGHKIHLLRHANGKLNTGLLGLLATGEDKYIQVVRDHLHAAKWAKPPKDPMVLVGSTQPSTSWHWGYRMLVLTEYHLLTGDKYVLPAIRMYAEAMAAGQDAAGIWGHRMANPKTNRAWGYGSMNQPTMPCFISLILARKCGVDSPRISVAIRRTTDHYIRKYLNKGSLPYGNHGPGKLYNNNGSSAALAVALAAVGHVEGARFFTRMSMASYNNMEQGHATWFFKILWTPLGANVGGPEASAAFFKKTSWLIPHHRRWRGGYGGHGSDLGSSGSYLLWLCSGRRKLHITGKGVDPAIRLNAQEIEETMNVHKYVNELIPMGIDELLKVADTHWSPRIRGVAVWKLFKFKREDIEASVRKRLKAGRSASALRGVSRLWDKTPAIIDEVAAIMRDKSADLEARVKAAGVLGSCAWNRKLEPKEEWTKADYEAGILHKPALKYFPDLVHVIAEEEENDPHRLLDRAAGGALAKLGDPYKQNLITDKPLFYKAVNKLLAEKESSATRSHGMGLIAESMPLEDFHYVADMVVHATRGTDREYTVYRGDKAKGLGIKLLARLNIQEAFELKILSLSTATRGKEKARHLAGIIDLARFARPYLPQLKAAIENELQADPESEGFTKDVPLSKSEIAKVVQEVELALQKIEKDPNAPKIITVEEAKQIGLEASKQKENTR